MNSRIVISSISILSALALVGGATFAFFSDVGTSTGNTFGAGTFNLKLGNGETAASDDVSATWTGSNMIPGGAGISATLNLKNTGTVAGNHIHFKAANTLTDNPLAEDNGSMAKHLKITALTYDSGDILSLVTDTNGNGHADLEDLESGGDGLQIGSLTNLGVDHPLFMTVQLDSAANNTYQSDSVSTIFTVTLHQDASQ